MIIFDASIGRLTRLLFSEQASDRFDAASNMGQTLGYFGPTRILRRTLSVVLAAAAALEDDSAALGEILVALGDLVVADPGAEELVFAVVAMLDRDLDESMRNRDISDTLAEILAWRNKLSEGTSPP